MPSRASTNFEIQKYYQNEPKFNGIYWRNNLLKIKNGTYVINIDDDKAIITNRAVSYVHSNNGRSSYNAAYFHSFRVQHIPKEIKIFIGTKKIITSIYRIQAYNSKMCRYFILEFFLLNVKSCLVYANLFSPNEYGKNDKIFSVTKKVKMKKIYCVNSGKYRKLKNPKIWCIFEKLFFFLLFAVIM